MIKTLVIIAEKTIKTITKLNLQTYSESRIYVRFINNLITPRYWRRLFALKMYDIT